MSKGSRLSLFKPHSWTALFGKNTASDAVSTSESLSYWQSQLRDLPAPLELPTVHTSSLGETSITTTKKASQSAEIDSLLFKDLEHLATEEDSNIFTLLLSAYFILLYRYTSEEDIVIGCARPIGHLVDCSKHGNNLTNMIFIRLNLSADQSFQKLFETLKQTITTASAHLAPTSQEILQLTSAGQNSNSLFQIQFSIEDSESIETAKSDNFPQPHLRLRITRDHEQLKVHFDYDEARFDASTIQRLLNHYKNLLLAIASNPRQTLSELKLLSSQEQNQLLKKWNDTSIELPQVSAIHELFEANATDSPESVAIVYRDQHLTYSALNARANQLAHYLRTQGVEPGTLVGIYMERCIDAVIAILAVLKAGGAYLPLDASYPKERLSYIMKDAQTNILLSHASLVTEIEAQNNTIIRIDSDWETIADKSPHNPQNHTQPAHLAFVLYTSGSTGDPKGVEVTHSNLINYFFAWEHTHQLRSSISGVCQMAFFSFAVFQGDVIRALCSGKKLLLCSREALLSPRQLFELIRREEADFAEFVPVLLRGLLEFAEETNQNLAFMKVIIVGADRWYWREHNRVKKLCGPNTRFIHVYGLSETTLDSTYFVKTDEILDDNQLVPIGRPFPNIQAYVLDNHKQPMPIGATGTLYVGGAGVAKGYHKRPELTAEKFTVDPFTEDRTARLYNTGDLARYLPDGNIAFLGRSDHQVKIRGFRVELGEIEASLEKHPAIHTAIVQPRQTTTGTTQLVAYYTSSDNTMPSARDIQSFLQGKLPEFMVPAFFVSLETLPLTPSGKINRRVLPDPLSDETSKVDHCTDHTDVKQTNDIQNVVTDICNHALGTNLAPNDNFLEKGSDSMAIMTMVTGLEINFGIEVEDEEINPQLFATVNSLTAYVENKLNT